MPRARLGRLGIGKSQEKCLGELRGGGGLNILFFLMVPLIYIQVLKVEVLRDACFILLINLKSDVGRKRPGQCVPSAQPIKREKGKL